MSSISMEVVAPTGILKAAHRIIFKSGAADWTLDVQQCIFGSEGPTYCPRETVPSPCNLPLQCRNLPTSGVVSSPN